MRTYIIPFILLLFIYLPGCKNADPKKEVINGAEITKDFQSWWTYHYNNIHLTSDFKPLDTDHKEIGKQQFLEALISGKYIPLKITSSDSSLQYILYPIPATANKNINSTISGTTIEVLDRFKREGVAFPPFKWTDMEGNTYTNDNTKGKIVVLKFWFIHCVPCVQEMPAVNEIFKEYSNRKDVQFISLAFDAKKDLLSFLQKKSFLYPVVSVDQSYVMNDLRISSFPTHLVIDRNGKIARIFDRYEEMAAYLNKITTE